MSPNKGTATGFDTIDDAVALIKSDRDDNVVVDMDYLITRKKWIETGHNFRIPKIRRLAPEEIYRTKRGKMVYFASTGEMNVYVATNFDKELLIKTINDKYRELKGREYRELGVRGVSTVADDAQGKNAVRPRANTPIAKEGQAIGEGTISTSNGDFAV